MSWYFVPRIGQKSFGVIKVFATIFLLGSSNLINLKIRKLLAANNKSSFKRASTSPVEGQGIKRNKILFLVVYKSRLKMAILSTLTGDYFNEVSLQFFILTKSGILQKKQNHQKFGRKNRYILLIDLWLDLEIKIYTFKILCKIRFRNTSYQKNEFAKRSHLRVSILR